MMCGWKGGGDGGGKDGEEEWLGWETENMSNRGGLLFGWLQGEEG
jgi:hypothetical protein